ncbi:Crp/Fnr family transcriptional regulator [Chryseobacterium pennipullorum]|uniref:Crp/Fnr family transcriptional regulator n=1 Tax=Chryseobacterium pennipullorum TaxID=2258963 RepID=A0A3D9B862_9FLAO|nr:Crp/Fnr family transcriptional regulator [Chryseobacterium pennipullorum]REC49517.1 Crp/Fnr family transcriptional regulator [Chryseobacterium pennipullorum]
MEQLLQYINSLTSVSDTSWALLQPALTQKTYRKNELMLQEGKICNSLFYIDKGFCKSYYEIEGVIKNTGFFFENEITTNLSSFGTGEPSAFNIVACEEVHAVLFDKERLFDIARKVHEIEALGRHCIRKFALKQEEFSNLFKLYSARERLEYLETQYPEMIQRVPLTQLASFLGVARETLSRIRKRRVTPSSQTSLHPNKNR